MMLISMDTQDYDGVYSTAVYNSLSRHADFHTQECFPSIEKIKIINIKIDKKSAIKGIKGLKNGT